MWCSGPSASSAARSLVVELPGAVAIERRKAARTRESSPPICALGRVVALLQALVGRDGVSFERAPGELVA